MAKNWTRHYLLIPIVMFVLAASGLMVLWRELNRIEIRMLSLRTQTTTEQVALRIESFIQARLHLLRQLSDEWKRYEADDPEQFTEIVQAIQGEFSSFQAINWVDAKGVIRWVVPEESNLAAKDRPLAGHAGLSDVLAKAVRTHAPVASFPLDLFQGGRGFATYFPVEQDGQSLGYLNGVFRMERVILDCLDAGVLGSFDLVIKDDGVVLYEYGGGGASPGWSYACEYPVRVLDRTWVVTLTPTAGLVSAYRTHTDEVLLVLGLLLAAALAVTLGAYLRRQAALWESEQRLRLAVENMPAMVAAFDRQGRIIVWNRHCEAVTGYPEAQIVGNPAAERLLQPKRVNQESSASAPFGLATDPGQEWLLTCKDGGVRAISWSNASGDLQVPGWRTWGVGTDITERRKAEGALRITQFAMDNAAIATFWVREDAHFWYVNQAACESLGYTRDELLRLTTIDIDPDLTRETWAARWEAGRQLTGPQIFETVHRRKDGSTFPVEVTARMVQYKGEYWRFAFTRDLTERKRAENERITMERALLETQKLESLGLLAGGVAHDFNNLLTAMMGSVSLARGMVDDRDPLAANLDQILSASQQAAELARQLLAYSGRGKFVVSVIDLRNVVHETDQLLRVSMSKRVSVTQQLASTPAWIAADPSQIRQVVMNLVLNAAEAIGDVDGNIAIRVDTIDAPQASPAQEAGDSPPVTGRLVVLEVSDNGCGMDAKTQARLFDPFYSTKGTGRGLGLAAVQGIVRGHGGSISVDSAPGRGSTIRILLPMSDAPAQEPRSAEKAGAAPTSGGTILVIDDEPSVRAVAKLILEDAGYTVLIAEDGHQGVEQFQTHMGTIDAVLLDMIMPKMDGRETLAHLQRLQPDIRVLMSSGYDEQHATNHVAGGGRVGFIQKPYRAEQLLEHLQSVLAG